MKRKAKYIAMFLAVAMLAGCGAEKAQDNAESDTLAGTDAADETRQEAQSVLEKIDMSKWQYNEEDGVYWQVQLSYCTNPADEEYETLGIFVPAAYVDGTANGDGTYTCQWNPDEEVAGYTVETAPIVIPVDTPGYSAMAAPSDYVRNASAYTDAGFIYVNAGCRGRDAGAPAGITDLKAAVRYLRYNGELMPGDTDRIFTFGMSGGGAQSSLMGATGNSELYTPYLEEIGAVMETSDEVAGAMCWCPITALDYANEAYEWNMGVTRTGLDSEMQELSDGLAEAFAAYLNCLELTDAEGNVLVLTESEEGIYQAGSYYDYIKGVIEGSLNNFLSDTAFPYTAGGAGNGGMRGGFDEQRKEAPEGGFDGQQKEAPEEGFDEQRKEAPEGGFDGQQKEAPEEGFDGQLLEGGEPGLGAQRGGKPGELPQDITELDGVNRIYQAEQDTATYETVQDYIDHLNENTEWVIYDNATNTAEITCIADFVTACKQASKSVGAFDDLNSEQAENLLFGYGDGSGAHFDSVMAGLLVGTEYESAYSADLEKVDALGNSVEYRMNMYNPMYYLEDYYEGYQTSDVAKYWRIRTGIAQGDTSLTVEVNLALALENYGGLDVDFETVWAQGHTEAERTGASAENFIAWVNECLGK